MDSRVSAKNWTDHGAQSPGHGRPDPVSSKRFEAHDFAGGRGHSRHPALAGDGKNLEKWFKAIKNKTFWARSTRLICLPS